MLQAQKGKQGDSSGDTLLANACVLGRRMRTYQSPTLYNHHWPCTRFTSPVGKQQALAGHPMGSQ